MTFYDSAVTDMALFPISGRKNKFLDRSVSWLQMRTAPAGRLYNICVFCLGTSSWPGQSLAPLLCVWFPWGYFVSCFMCQKLVMNTERKVSSWTYWKNRNISQ